MSVQQQDRMSGLNALGGCMFGLLIFFGIPALSYLLGIKAALLLVAAGMAVTVIGIGKAKENV